MTHEERECERQRVRDMASVMSLDTLRRARAKLLDVVEASGGNPPEVIVLRGEVVHAEIQRREAGEGTRESVARAARRLWTGTGAEWVEHLARTDGQRGNPKPTGIAAQGVKNLLAILGLVVAGIVIVLITTLIINATMGGG